MGRHGKRSYKDYRSGSRPDNTGMGETLREVKRARVSPEHSSARQDIAMTSNRDDTGGEWQTVRSKASKKSRNDNATKSRPLEHHTDGPRVYFQDRYAADRSVIPAKELRDLALYVLADGVAPTWVAVKQARDIRKVVTIMLPGFDEEMVQKAQSLLAEHEAGQQSNDQPATTSNSQATSLDPNNIDSSMHGANDVIQDDTLNHSTSMQDAPATDTTISNGVKQLSEKDLHWLFSGRIQVKAPGDTKWSKVHSPLQAMLMKGHDDDSDKKNFHQPQEKSFQANRTPITHFIHTADELREAEYPIHPATFTFQADGALEIARRTGAGQMISDGWVDTEVSVSAPVIPAATKASPYDHVSQGLTIYGIDCEMVLTSDEKSSLARVSLVSWPDGKVVLDKFVKPTLEITNYFTQYSGITPQILENVTTTLSDIQTDLLTLLTPSTILLGHSLESDLNALKLTHPFIIDTSMIYPHPRGLPLRSSLKFLANKYLKREIQTAGANGHDSVEDARAVLDLVKLKCEKGPRWGTTEANGESIFKHISRHHGPDGKGRTTAIVEYGTPERGYGKDATLAIGCQNDDEVIAGIIRASLGDSTSTPSTNNPTGVDYTWSRLRSLELARGWVTNSPLSTTSLLSSPTSSDTTTIITPLLSLLSHLQTLYNTLSSSQYPTLLILYSGTGPMDPVLKLQQQQNQYRKEFKVKKWDELSVKWTDTEEQELRAAVERARRGWGWVGVV